MDWKKFFTEFPGQFPETEFYKQVGKTVGGKPVTPEQFEGRLSDIRNGLRLEQYHAALDLCCGNGLITTEIAKVCQSIVGVDFSEPLIAIAKKYNNPPNATYLCMSVLEEQLRSIEGAPFSRVYMYESLQHFQQSDLPLILQNIVAISTPDVVVFLGGIPDIDRLWDFYNTEERRQDYWRRKARNEEAIGTWWKKEDLINLSLAQGFACEILPQSPTLDSYHYRMDARLTRLAG